MIIETFHDYFDTTTITLLFVNVFKTVTILDNCMQNCLRPKYQKEIFR